jgi:cellulose synthase (UDP-forming)
MLPELGPSLVLAGLAVLVLPALPRDHRWARAAVMGGGLLCLGRYLLWRLGETLPPFALEGGALWMWLLAVAETMTLGNAMLTALVLCRPGGRRDEADAAQARLAMRLGLPAVDVIIPTYNEPLEVVERSILGALALDWPEVRVWVLDDGRREWLRDYCVCKGARWVTRTGNDGGKAGNVNAWLAAGQASAPYILVLDADFVVQRGFLRRVLGLFDAEDVALVQTPQSFFNPDPIQMNLLAGAALADEQRFFYHHFQPSLDAWGAAFCCGTSFVVRRDRLEAVGGIPTCTVTEDMMTTYALAARGWRTVYLNEKLSVGLAPEGLGEFISQRARWCLGTVQALASPCGPLRARGLSWPHRLCFLNAQLFWLGSVPMMLLAMLAPAVWWWTGVPAFQASSADFFSHFGPRFIAEAAAMAWVSRWSVMPVLSGVAPLVVAPTAMAAAARALLRPRGHDFKVTAKGGDRRRIVVHGRLLAWLLALMAIIAIGMAVQLRPGAPGQWVNVGWTGYALLILFLGVLVAVELPRRRRQERVAFDEPALLGGRPARLLDLSVTGACVEGEAEGDDVFVDVAGVGSIAARVLRRQGRRLHVEFHDVAACHDALVRKLFTGSAVLGTAACDPGRALRAAAWRGFVSPL